MSGVSFSAARQNLNLVDKGFTVYQENFDAARNPLIQHNTAFKIAELSLRTFRQDPGFWKSTEQQALLQNLSLIHELDERLRWQDSEGAYKRFVALPSSLQTILSYAAWLNDFLLGLPIDSIDYGMESIKTSPLRLGDPAVLPVIHARCGSLVHQLKAQLRQIISCKSAAHKASGFFAGAAEKTTSERIAMASDLCDYYRVKMLFPYMKDSYCRDAVFKDLSSSVLSWLRETKDLPIAEKYPEYIYESRGAHYRGGKTHFSLFAPQAKNVSVVLTAFGSELSIQPMEKFCDGTWQCSVDNCNPGQAYLYRIVDVHGSSFDKVDPFSFSSVFVREKGALHSIVVDRKSFTWKDDQFLAERRLRDPLHSPHSILELHAKSWAGRDSNIISTAKRLASYCQYMGFTHVELYGLMQHFCRDAISYQVSNLFSPHDSLGSYQEVKQAIEILHSFGIGVILDWIPAHHDHGPHNAEHFSASSYLIDGTDHLFHGSSPWGTFLFDFSKPETKRMIEASLFWWIDEFHVDGIRVDAASHLFKHDGHDLPQAKQFFAYLLEKVKAQRPGVVIFAEATDWDPKITSPAKEYGIGFHFNWNVGARVDMQNFLKTPPEQRSLPEHFDGKLKKVFEEAMRSGGEKKIMTYSHDDSDAGASHHNTLFNLSSSKITDPMQRMADIRNYLGFLIFAPSWGHLMHMGDEFAQPESWSARLSQGKDPVDWRYLENPSHKGVQHFVKDAIAVYKKRSGFWKNGAEGTRLVHAFQSNRIIAYIRSDNLVLHNFSEKNYSSYILNLGNHAKAMKVLNELINSNDTKYHGSGSCINFHSITLQKKGEDSLANVAVAAFSSTIFAMS